MIFREKSPDLPELGSKKAEIGRLLAGIVFDREKPDSRDFFDCEKNRIIRNLTGLDK